MAFSQVQHVENFPTGTIILVGDIGGTNSNFAIFKVENKRSQLLVTFRTPSQEIVHFSLTVKELLALIKEQYGTIITHACLAVAGVPSIDNIRIKPTNLSFIVDTAEIKKITTLTSVSLVNDFEVIGYGLDQINREQLVHVNKGIPREKGHRAIIGAGTGLGKCIMFWNSCLNRYEPIASEGGHADFPTQTQEEIDLIKYIQEYEGWGCNVSWEDLLSGNGIKRMYHYFCHINDNEAGSNIFNNDGPHPDKIFKLRNQDKNCNETFTLYSQIYGRCAKDFALDALALGGVYIAGGIAANNLALFEQPSFNREFINCGKQRELLATIPIYVITDYNVSLYGAAQYMILKGLCA